MSCGRHARSCFCREAIGAPGMVVLQFAWGGGPSNVHLPHMHYDNCFVYPGTHDNETSVGWFKGRSVSTGHVMLMSTPSFLIGGVAPPLHGLHGSPALLSSSSCNLCLS